MELNPQDVANGHSESWGRGKSPLGRSGDLQKGLRGEEDTQAKAVVGMERSFHWRERADEGRQELERNEELRQSSPGGTGVSFPSQGRVQDRVYVCGGHRHGPSE